MSYVEKLQCGSCREEFPAGRLWSLCPDCAKPLLVRYNLGAIRELDLRGRLANRPPDMWRYLEVLPVDSRDEVITLGEGFTPLLPMPQLTRKYRVRQVLTKDESLNPTGSFKARGLAAAVTMARKLGARKLAIPSAGNAGGAMAAYAARAGLESYVFVPCETPDANVLEAEILSTKVELVEGVITDAGRLVGERKDAEGWFDLSTLKEPYRIEGKKTMGYEIAEQMEWTLPDVILYPTGGGTGLIGMWKAFDEMEQLGWIGSTRPRMVAVQSDGCAPNVDAFFKGKEHAPAWPSPVTYAAGIRVPAAVGDFLILRAIRESGGCAVAVSDRETYDATSEVGRAEGLLYCPEGAACWAAFRRLRAEGWIRDQDRVVVFNTGAAQKYTDFIRKFQASSGE
ncbi:MAG: threonine synthase [Acidobacteriota bacterium]|nr:MAG: threonine synthase [Acidobacteriota bacterium]